jgi:hypothetical protein
MCGSCFVGGGGGIVGSDIVCMNVVVGFMYRNSMYIISLPFFYI